MFIVWSSLVINNVENIVPGTVLIYKDGGICTLCAPIEKKETVTKSSLQLKCHASPSPIEARTDPSVLEGRNHENTLSVPLCLYATGQCLECKNIRPKLAKSRLT